MMLWTRPTMGLLKAYPVVNNKLWACEKRLARGGALLMGRRRRSKTPKEKPPKKVMVQPIGGIPEVAQVHPESYDRLLNEKVKKMETMIHEAFNDAESSDPSLAIPVFPSIETFRSPREAFRMRANFKIWRTEDEEKGFGAHYVMFERGDNRTPHEVQFYPMGSKRLQNLMEPLIVAIRETDELRERINDVRFLTTLEGDALITMTYNRPIGEAWTEAVSNLSGSLNGVKFVGRSRKVKLVVGGDTVKETLNVPNRGSCHYAQTEGAFSQPNAVVCEKMLGWAYDVTRGSYDDDLCELYCGNGCFTIALAPNFRRVIATEMSKSSVRLAQQNLASNDVQNARVGRLAAEDFVEVFNGKSFRRLDEAGIRIVKQELKTDTEEAASDQDDSVMYFDRLKTLFVDPPRAGLDVTCRKLATEFERIVYVSCNPETLARDLAELAITHEPIRIAAFDQFPYTPHLEAGVVLKRREK